MREYTIQHVCGHTSTKVFHEKEAIAAKKAQWLATKSCTQCYFAENPSKPTAIVQPALLGNVSSNTPKLSIYVINSFEIREHFSSASQDASGNETKRRREGWRFDKSGYLVLGKKAAGAKSKPAWIFEGSAEDAEVQIEWLASIGVQVGTEEMEKMQQIRNVA